MGSRYIRSLSSGNTHIHAFLRVMRIMLVLMRDDAYFSYESTPNDLDLTSCATVSLANAAKVLGVHRSTAWDLQRRGEFPVPVLRIGSRLRVTKLSLAQFLRTGVATSGAQP